MKVTEKQKQNAVARILGDVSDVATEAQHLGVDGRTIKRWLSAVRKVTKEAPKAVTIVPETVTPTVTTNVLSPNVTPPEEVQQNAVLDTLLQEENVQGDNVTDGVTPAELAIGRAEAENFCVDAIAGLKAAAGSVLVHTVYAPPLDASSPEVLKMLEMGAIAKTAIRANAPRLYPILVKYAGTWTGLAIALGADAYCTMMGLQAAAIAKGWEPKKKKQEQQQAPGGPRLQKAVGGKPEDLREQIERARSTMKADPPATPQAEAAVPIVQTPTAGTINAPSAVPKAA